MVKPIHRTTTPEVHYDHTSIDENINDFLSNPGPTSTPKLAAQNAEKLEKTPHKSTIQKIRKWATLPIRLPLDVVAGAATVGTLLVVGIPIGIGSLIGGGIGALTGPEGFKKGLVGGAIVTGVIISPALLAAGIILTLAFGMAKVSAAIKGGDSPTKLNQKLEVLRNELSSQS